MILEWTESLFDEIVAKNFPNSRTEIDVQIQEAERTPTRVNPKRPTLRHIIIKLTKTQRQRESLKSQKEKQLIMYNGTLIELAIEILQTKGSGIIYSEF